MPHSYEYPRAALTVDCVVFGLDEEDLKVVLSSATWSRLPANGRCPAGSSTWTNRWRRPPGGNCRRRRGFEGVPGTALHASAT